MITVTPIDLADLKMGLARDIAGGNKAAAIGSLYTLSVNTGQFIESQGADLARDSRVSLCEEVLKYAKRIDEMSGVMDQDDAFVWSEALDHMRLSFMDRCPQLLGDVATLAGETQVTELTTGSAAQTYEPRI